KRKEFHKLIADAQKPNREWQAIVCWDTSRFGRLDSLAGAEYKQPLRKAGVWLETTRGERIDWTTSTGRLMDAMKAEQDNDFSLKLSRDVIRGRKTVVEMGYWCTVTPYGYDRQYVENDQVRM